jgi:hypothetical protein
VSTRPLARYAWSATPSESPRADLDAAEPGVEAAGDDSESELRKMLDHLRGYPIGVRTSMLTWEAWLSWLDPDEQRAPDPPDDAGPE